MLRGQKIETAHKPAAFLAAGFFALIERKSKLK